MLFVFCRGKIVSKLEILSSKSVGMLIVCSRLHQMPQVWPHGDRTLLKTAGWYSLITVYSESLPQNHFSYMLALKTLDCHLKLSAGN